MTKYQIINDELVKTTTKTIKRVSKSLNKLSYADKVIALGKRDWGRKLRELRDGKTIIMVNFTKQNGEDRNLFGTLHDETNGMLSATDVEQLTKGNNAFRNFYSRTINHIVIDGTKYIKSWK